MPIKVSEIVSRLNARLDAEGSDRYTLEQDYKPAIKAAMESIITALNQAFSENKLSPENLSELMKVKIWETNNFSRVAILPDDIKHSVWTIISVFPKPVLNKNVGLSIHSSDSVSKYRKDLSFIKSDYSAKRLTFEEWNENAKNVFTAGNNILKGELSEYAYLDLADYSSDSYTGNLGACEIQVRPDIPKEFVAIAYLKYPDDTLDANGSIEFPQSITEIVVDLSLAYISYKRGEVSLYQISESNAVRLISLIKQ